MTDTVGQRSDTDTTKRCAGMLVIALGVVVISILPFVTGLLGATVLYVAFHRPMDVAGSREERRARSSRPRAATIEPETRTEDDPVPFRTIVFRTSLEEVRGRAAYLRTPCAPRSGTKCRA